MSNIDHIDSAVCDWVNTAEPKQLVKSWQLIVETIAVDDEDPAATSVILGHSDGLSHVAQVGLIEYARTLVHREVGE